MTFKPRCALTFVDLVKSMTVITVYKIHNNELSTCLQTTFIRYASTLDIRQKDTIVCISHKQSFCISVCGVKSSSRYIQDRSPPTILEYLSKTCKYT